MSSITNLTPIILPIIGGLISMINQKGSALSSLPFLMKSFFYRRSIIRRVREWEPACAR